MASVLTAPSPETTNDVPTETTEASAQSARSVPARHLIRLGRTATVREGLNWITVTTITMFHAGALAAFFFFSWQRLAVMAVLYVLAINVGIGMCYHRLLTHRGYQTPKWVEYVMTIFATMALEGGPIFWVVHASRASPAQRPGRRSAHAPRRRLVGARRLDLLRRGAARADSICWRATRPI